MASEKIQKIKQKPFNFTNTEAIPLIKEENQKKNETANEKSSVGEEHTAFRKYKKRSC